MTDLITTRGGGVVPYLFYEDVARAIDWVTSAFGLNVDAHCARARAAGADIVEEPREMPFGDRLYLARDLEGHEWYFAQHLRDVVISELQKALGG